MLIKSYRRLFVAFQLNFVLNKVNVTHLHMAFSANAEPLWEKMDAIKVAPKALQLMPFMSRKTVS